METRPRRANGVLAAFVRRPAGNDNIMQTLQAISDWLLLATRWRSDGTPMPDIKLTSALRHGDPLAYIYLGTVILIVIGSAFYCATRKR